MTTAAVLGDGNKQAIAVRNREPVVIGRRFSLRPGDTIRTRHHPITRAAIGDGNEQTIAVRNRGPIVVGR